MAPKIKIIFIATLLLVLGLNCLIPLHPDEAYYWEWGRHLSWSYYDGPPMVAYLIRLFTELMGNSVFVVKLASVSCLALTAYLLYRFSRYLFDQKTAEVALLIFLFLPFVQFFYHAMTPDSPLLLFWIATLYSFYLAVNEQKSHYFYLAGILGGLLLLSKYTGVLLLASLFLTLLFSRQYRSQFKNIHLYLAALLALIVFSPVIIWNYETHWIGFAFQWHHGVSQQKVFSWKLLGLFLGGQVGAYSPIFFFTLLVLLIKKRTEIFNNIKLYYLLWPTLVPILFFMYNGMFAKSEPNWPAPAYISATMMLAYWIEKNHYYRTYIAGIICNGFVFFALLIMIFLPNNFISDKFPIYPDMLKQAASDIKPGDMVLADKPTWAGVIAFYLPGQPNVSVVPYSPKDFWSAAIRDKKLVHAWLITKDEESIRNYEDLRCELRKELLYQGFFITKAFHLYECRSVG